jgi:hypothetical protein
MTNANSAALLAWIAFHAASHGAPTRIAQGRADWRVVNVTFADGYRNGFYTMWTKHAEAGEAKATLRNAYPAAKFSFPISK